MRLGPLGGSILVLVMLSGCLGGVGESDPEAVSARNVSRIGANQGFVPHVLIGIPDTGINPYHKLFYRPNLTEHPCTYLQGFSCDMPALELSVGGDSWTEMFESDREIWNSLQRNTWYWIPKTVFVAVSCGPSGSFAAEICILDDGYEHGTWVVSAAIRENPDALIAFAESNGGSISAFTTDKIPVDIYSVSWSDGPGLPLMGDVQLPAVYVRAAGNGYTTTIPNSHAGHPNIISVGGAYPEDRTQPSGSHRNPEIVSYYIRQMAKKNSASEMVLPPGGGTSFASPSAAGGLSKVVLEVRRSSGYTGSIEGGVVDPIARFTVPDLREAMNRTATYEPQSRERDTGKGGQPRIPNRPWIQWGWGFYDGHVANATIDHVLGFKKAPEKPEAAKEWMGAVHAVKKTWRG